MDSKTISIDFGSILLLAFIILKLCGVINWSWVWVLCPLWIGFALVALIAVIALIINLRRY